MSTNLTFPHEAAKRQLDKIALLAQQLDAGYTVDHFHTSKSIQLPVPTIRLPGLVFMVRDNFHDLNLYVKSETEINLPLSFFYKPRNFEWYSDVIQKKRNYSFRDWSDEELNDLRILRVQRKNGNGWCEVEGEEKDRWLARASSTSWYTRDWSSGLLLTSGPSPFTDATTFYAAESAFGQGIPHHPQPYSGPCKEFLNCVDGNWDEVLRLCLGIKEHILNQPPPA